MCTCTYIRNDASICSCRRTCVVIRVLVVLVPVCELVHSLPLRFKRAPVLVSGLALAFAPHIALVHVSVLRPVLVHACARKCTYETCEISLRRCFNFLGAILLALGFVLRSLQAIVGPHGAILESCCGLLRPIWVILGPLGAILGAILKPLGAILGTFWGNLVAVLRPYKASWGHLAASWGLLGPSWGPY